MDFKGRVALITGAGSRQGIGREIALFLAKNGADVVVADYNLEGAKEVSEEVGSFGRKAIAVQVDVANSASVDGMVDSALNEFGKVDILVNSAGITQPVKVIDTPEADWDRIIAVNLKGTFLCSKAVLKSMMKQNYGRIVNLSSVSAKRGGGVYGGAHYSAAKAGVLGFAKALAREVAEYGITVNSVCPGMIETNIRKNSAALGVDPINFKNAELPTEVEQAIIASVPVGRLGYAIEVAETVAFLASDGAAYITGEDIDINGGSHMD